MLIRKNYILGVKTEGILRQAADVEDVERRIQEYEKGWLVCLMHRLLNPFLLYVDAMRHLRVRVFEIVTQMNT